MTSVLQQKILEHINDVDLPRYTIVLEGVDGECYLPKGVRLFLKNCGPVTVTSTEGNNQFSYINSEAVIIESMTDCILTVKNASNICDIKGLDNVRGNIVNIQSKHLNTSKCQINTQDSALGNCYQSDSTLDHKNSSMNLLEATNCNVSMYGGEIVTFTSTGTEYKGDQTEITDWTSSDDKINYYKSTILSTFTSGDSYVTFNQCPNIKKITLSNCDFFNVETTITDKASLTETRTQSRSSKYEDTVDANKGYIYSRKDSFKAAVTLGEIDKVSSESTYEKSVSFNKGRSRLDTNTFNLPVTYDAVTYESTNNTYADTFTSSGGSLTKKGDKHAGTYAASGLVGRNKSAKCAYSGAVSFGGDGKSYLEDAENSSSNCSTTGFSKVDVYKSTSSQMSFSDVDQLTTYKCSGDLTVSNTGQFVASGCGNLTLDGVGQLLASGCGTITGKSGQMLLKQCGAINAQHSIVLSDTIIASGSQSLLIYNNNGVEFKIKSDLVIDIDAPTVKVHNIVML